jgi:hypothetical protein
MADRLVIETTILIDHRRDHLAAVSLVGKLLAKNVALVHPVSAGEVQGDAHGRVELGPLQP